MRVLVDAMGRSMRLRTRDQSAIKLDKDSGNSTCSGRLSPQRYYVLFFPSVFHESERSIVERLPEEELGMADGSIGSGNRSFGIVYQQCAFAEARVERGVDALRV